MHVMSGARDGADGHFQIRKTGAQLRLLREHSSFAANREDWRRRLRAHELDHRLADRERRMRAQERIPFPGERVLLFGIARDPSGRQQARRLFRERWVVAYQPQGAVVDRLDPPPLARRVPQVLEIAREPRRDLLRRDAQWYRVDHREVRYAAGPERRVDQGGCGPHRMPHDADRLLGRENLQRAVQVRDVLDEMVEAARPDPLRIAVAAEVERDRAPGEQRREQVERAGVVEPAVQEQGHLAFAPLDAVQPEATDVQQSVVHGGERISLTRIAPFATRVGWRTLSSASSWGARLTWKCSTARRRC